MAHRLVSRWPQLWTRRSPRLAGRGPWLLVAVLALLLAPGGAFAAECPRTSLGDVEDEVMCPVCGTPLALATEAPQAVRQRELIRRLVERCRSKEEIKARLEAELGQDVVALPGNKGFDLAAYLVPGLAILLAGGAVAATALQWRRARGRPGDAEPVGGPPGGRPAGTEAVGATPSSGADEKRLQSDLDRYEL